MATLEKMKICGIRCFGSREEDIQSLRFKKPLTLILGSNGCGKSTIIESLRYVTAQKEPAGKGVFVHHPSLDNAEAVKGYVKLKLSDANGRPVHLSKSIQARKTPKGLSVNNLDSTVSLMNPNTGKMSSISNKCVDFTHEIFRIFGVSKAILENVIFCTQEDSFWPLDTDLKLKEKFDQIFDSDKYNKCLKKVRDYRKKTLEDKKNSEVEFKHLQQSKNAAAAKRTQLANLEKEIEELNAQIEVLNASLVPVLANIKEIDEKQMKVSEVYTKRETTKIEVQRVEKLIQEFEEKIRVANCQFNGSDDNLEKALKGCDEQLLNVTALKTELLQIESREKQCNERIKTKNLQIAEFKNLIKVNGEKESELNTKMENLAVEMGMETTFITFDGLERRLNARETTLLELQVQKEKEEEDKQLDVDKAREVVYAQEIIVKQKQEALVANQKERAKLRIEMEDVDASQARVDRVASNLRQASEDLSDHLRIHNIDAIKEQMSQFQNKLRETEDELLIVENNVSKIQELTAVMKELEVQQEVLSTRNTDIRRLKSRHNDSLMELLGNVPESGFKDLIDNKLKAQKLRQGEIQTQLTQKEKEVTTLEGRRRYLTEALQEKKGTLEKCLDQMFNETNGSDWEQTVSAMKKIVDDLQETKGTLASSSCMYERYIKQLKRPKACCPLCERDFSADEEAKTLAEKLRVKIQGIPNLLSDNMNNLSKNQDKLNRLLALQSVQDRVRNLRETEIPNLSKELEEVESKLVQLKKDVAALSTQKLQPDRAVEICSGLVGDMALLDKLNADLLNVQSEIKKLEVRIPSNTPSTGLRDALAKQDELRHSRKITRTNLDESQARLHRYNEQLQKLQSDKHRLAEELRQLEGGAGNRSVLEERCFELQALEGQLDIERMAAQEAVEPLKQTLNEIIAALRKLKDDNRILLESRRKDIHNLKKSLDDVRRLQKECSDFKNKNTEITLKNVKAESAAIENNLESLRTEKDSINAKVGSLAKNEVRRRELLDNKYLRERNVEKEKLTSELNDIESQFRGLAYKDLARERERLKLKEENIGKNKASIHGRLGALTARTSDVKDELNSGLLKNADENYKKELIRCNVLDSVAEDLLRYATAMEYSMSVYHKEQMGKVNEFVHEYWRKIYKGNDVDYVEIHTDEVVVSDNRRNYSYRLVMVKSGVRMDMRNRCSAGQKMLVCLIIRIALAQVFSANCGILTLDEPTTNLDAKNIDSLAETLHEIVQDKAILEKSNLQLIVITHDESFIEKLINMTDASSYILVSRGKTGRTRITEKECGQDQRFY